MASLNGNDNPYQPPQAASEQNIELTPFRWWRTLAFVGIVILAINLAPLLTLVPLPSAIMRRILAAILSSQRAIGGVETSVAHWLRTLIIVVLFETFTVTFLVYVASLMRRRLGGRRVSFPPPG
jgi:hypothetical protein